MILAHIIVPDIEQTMDIIKVLIENDLIFNAGISTKNVYEKNKENGTLDHFEQTLIIGKTKAMLFSKINDVLKAKYPNNMPMLYAIPIVYMDEEQYDLLRHRTASV